MQRVLAIGHVAFGFKTADILSFKLNSNFFKLIMSYWDVVKPTCDTKIVTLEFWAALIVIA